jgi:hypothetical protein
MMSMDAKDDARSHVLAEFTAYYLADEMPAWSDEEFLAELPETAAASAQRLFWRTEGKVSPLVEYLRLLATKPDDPILDEISNLSLIDWRDDWEHFQRLLGAIADALEQRAEGNQ